MHRFAGIAGSLLLMPLCAPPLPAQISVRQVKVLGSKDAVEIEVEVSGRVVPQTQMLTGPDRLVVDFPNALPGRQLRSQAVNRGEVKDLRVGLFQARPPITRIVLDLRSAQFCRVFPYARTAIIKVMGSAPGASAELADFVPAQPPRPERIVGGAGSVGRSPANAPAKPELDVSFRDGLLAIRANRATLAEVLRAVQQRTGAEISLAAGAEQEPVAANLGPAPAPEVLARLLNGSRFNFLILSAINDPRQLDRVILSPRSDVADLPPAMESDSMEEDNPAGSPPAPAELSNTSAPPVEAPRRPPPEIPAPAEDDAPEQ
jgi:hypothetical protein